VWGAKPRLAASGAPQLRERLNYRSSESRPADARTLGLTGTMEPASTQPRWLGEKQAQRPVVISLKQQTALDR
jgi:hypothetical protein